MIKYGQKLLKIHIGQQLLVGLFLFARNSSQVLFTKRWENSKYSSVQRKVIL